MSPQASVLQCVNTDRDTEQMSIGLEVSKMCEQDVSLRSVVSTDVLKGSGQHHSSLRSRSTTYGG